ncbi:MAG: hypothetical protein Q8P95_00490 [bacterium]|nr:hypothetical protein [bacterium]
MSQHPPHTGFFPNAASLAIFLLIMAGVVFGSLQFYPDMVRYFVDQSPKVPLGQLDVEPPPLLVEGVLTGVQLAQSIAKPGPSGPLNVNRIGGYVLGMKSALITARDWYNLDSQLFRSRGIAIGVQSALASSSSNEERGQLAYQVKLIQQMQAALAANLDEMLTANDDRQRILQNFVDQLRRMSDEAVVEISNLERVVAAAQAELEAQRSVAEQAQGSISTASESLATDNLDQQIDLYLIAMREAEKAKLTIVSSGRLMTTLKSLQPRLAQYLAAIEANFEALSLGVKIKPVKGLPLYKDVE